MKILILGSGGMAGHILQDKFLIESGFEVFNAARHKVYQNTILFNALDKQSLVSVLDKTKPDIIINAVGMLVKEANANPANAILVNSWFPHLVSQLTNERHGYTIHLSSDCVFSGHKGCYLINDVKDAEDFYGKTKGLGELNNENDLTIRTSIIGPEKKLNGTGLFDWYLKSPGGVTGFTNVLWSGITTLELYKVIYRSISMKAKGLIQVSNNRKISKYELLKMIGKHFNKDINLIQKSYEPVHDKSLICSVPEAIFQIPDYEQMIIEMKEYVSNNKNSYFHNYPNAF